MNCWVACYYTGQVVELCVHTLENKKENWSQFLLEVIVESDIIFPENDFPLVSSKLNDFFHYCKK